MLPLTWPQSSLLPCVPRHDGRKSSETMRKQKHLFLSHASARYSVTVTRWLLHSLFTSPEDWALVQHLTPLHSTDHDNKRLVRKSRHSSHPSQPRNFFPLLCEACQIQSITNMLLTLQTTSPARRLYWPIHVSDTNKKKYCFCALMTINPLPIYLKSSQVYLQEKLPALITTKPFFPKWLTFKGRGYVDSIQQVWR